MNGRSGSAAKARKSHVTATVSADKVMQESRSCRPGSRSSSRARGDDAGRFRIVRQGSRKGCPVSNAHRGTMQIEVEDRCDREREEAMRMSFERRRSPDACIGGGVQFGKRNHQGAGVRVVRTPAATPERR
jgi:hypothetical protein